MLRSDSPGRSPAAAILRLGQLAEQRGLDAAGLAWSAPDEMNRSADGGRWHIDRRTGSFSLLEGRLDLDSLDRATLILGHTRWATQGGRSANEAGPNSVGQIIGTHNGDLDIDTLPGDGRRVGDRTDSELLFAAVDACTRTGMNGQGDVGKLVALFAGMRGRAAAVWIRRTDHDRVQLLRAGLSPLVVGYDSSGGLWWASNPDWLRQLEEEQQLGIRRVRMIGEGELWQARVQRASRGNQWTRMSRVGKFVPVVRPSDVRLARTAVWRGFTVHDAELDKARLRHTMAVPGRPRAVFSRASAHLQDDWEAGPVVERAERRGRGWWPARNGGPGRDEDLDWPAAG